MAKYQELADSIIRGDNITSKKIAEKLVKEGVSATDILNNGLMPGMNVVGKKFKANEMYIPEVLIAARAMHAAMDIIKPLLTETDEELKGSIAIGTVQGDLHDIGKNLVGMLCEGAGFTVVDLGFDVSAEKILDAVKTHKPDVVGLSALLTTTMRVMGYTIKALQEAGLRDQVKVMVGGAPVDHDFAMKIGADGYGSNAPAGADLAKKLVGAA